MKKFWTVAASFNVWVVLILTAALTRERVWWRFILVMLTLAVYCYWTVKQAKRWVAETVAVNDVQRKFDALSVICAERRAELVQARMLLAQMLRDSGKVT